MFQYSGKKSREYVHISFEIGILFKGIDGMLEIIGGFLLIYLNSDRLNRLIRILTQHELSEDPDDLIANALLDIGSHFSIDARNFGIIYLVSHGLVKCIIIVFLWKRKLWVYPLSAVSMILFIGYQIYRYTIDHSVFLILLSVFDVILIILTCLEYQQVSSFKNSE